LIWLIQKGKGGIAVRALDLALNDEVFRAQDKLELMFTLGVSSDKSRGLDPWDRRGNMFNGW
jgi:hypothetical protein